MIKILTDAKLLIDLASALLRSGLDQYVSYLQVELPTHVAFVERQSIADVLEETHVQLSRR